MPEFFDPVDRERADTGRLVQRETAGHHVLRQLVADDGGRDDRDEAGPLPQPRAERALGDRDRDDCVSRRPDADIGLRLGQC